jgi:flagellar biosynthesis/type III secretory pathway chaperone
MNDDWTDITHSLRQELSEYGGLLNLFEEQQRALFDRDAAKVLQLSSLIERQVQVMQDCRGQREGLVVAFATANGRAPDSTLRSLIPIFESHLRPLLEAMVKEVNVLIHRIRRASQHNRILLASAVDSHQQTLRALRPDVFAQTYAPNGHARLSLAQPAPVFKTAG